jgi:nicotinate-nucleotide pyrophosphorylase (carboxylating)
VKSLTYLDQQTVFDQLPAIIRRALDEDIGDGDITSEATIPTDLQYEGILLAKAGGVVAGLEVARQVFLAVDPRVRFDASVHDGDTVRQGEVFALVCGPGRALLTAERTALNFLQRMSGIATLTRRYVDAVAATKAAILDTRKTVPGLRLLDKWAVALGGGVNHRIGLYDMALIKDNHIIAAGGISAAVERVRSHDTRRRRIEVEVKNLDELREVLALSVDQIMLDNMSLDDMAEAVRIANGALPLEASGNVSLETVAAIAATGVDYISVGKLTHSVQALDISFDLKPA